MSAHRHQARTREAARQAEEAARAHRVKQSRTAAAATALLVLVGAGALIVAGGGDQTSAGSGNGGLLTTAPPWQPQAEGVTERLAEFDFPPPGDESYHAHVLLSVFRDGRPVNVPAGIGFDAAGGHSSLHTHTPDGVIHMEADDPYPYELRQVFVAWGVAFDEQRLGGDVNAGDEQVHVYVNGEPAADGPALVLEDGDNIVVAFGEEGSFPVAPPADALQGA